MGDLCRINTKRKPLGQVDDTPLSVLQTLSARPLCRLGGSGDESGDVGVAEGAT
ncbi:hypothetical protein ACFFL1_17125 [Samsonia erythrinae]|uniref:Uncharacterized protein n=1 Tax=Samsonia erythrinae TaxID=160434 RepID=A0A4V2VTA9_9GAMM|nr:hypothetical protein [Samsonia erythrinae]TCV05745.1 hypothetical protein EDC54_10511 [Samsonia erythrinae]